MHALEWKHDHSLESWGRDRRRRRHAATGIGRNKLLAIYACARVEARPLSGELGAGRGRRRHAATGIRRNKFNRHLRMR
jgi:hypothetical protein